MATINQHEKKVLYMEKVEEGKTSQEANEEVKRDVNFERFLSKNNSTIERLKKIIDSKNEQIFLLKGRVRAIKSEKIKNKIKEDFSRDNGAYANTKELWRIITYLENYGKTNLNDLTVTCGFVAKKKFRDNAIAFLIKINLIKQKMEGRNIVLERC
jgi:hypothetical protein